ncbi:MAG: type II pantothenate kinase [Spirochaetota bacterium]
MVIGIDIGGTTTKIVGFKDSEPIDFITVKASDPITSASGALGKFLNSNNLTISSIKEIIITGAGSISIKSDLLGCHTTKIDEFKAIGLGGLYLSGLSKAIVVSMGTGTAIVKASGNSISHLGGTGVGGGTLLGLSKCILNTMDFDNIIDIARSGSLLNVDLTVGDIAQSDIGALPKHITASNFGKLSDKASKSDYALGILNLVFQTIGLLAIFAARDENYEDIVMTGQLIRVPQAKAILKELADMFKVVFHFPEHADYSTAIGAALSISR